MIPKGIIKMNLSKTSQYALKIMNTMALGGDENFTAQSLHKKLKIPYPYLRRLLTKLSAKKLIKSAKGRSGGYILAKNHEKISLRDILKATGEKEIFGSCLFGFGNCLLSERCAIHEKWTAAKENLESILNGTSLGDLKAGVLKNRKKTKSNK